MRKDKVLLVDDDSTLVFIIADALRREGFEVVCAADGETGLEAVAASLPDVVVADVMMPRLSGYEMVRRIRAVHPSMPVLFLTARTSIDDLLKGYESGGNDYLRKPFQLAELIVRIKALLNRQGQRVPETAIIELADCVLDIVRQRLTVGASVIDLSHIETQILKILFSSPNHVVEAEKIMMSIWHNDDYGNHNRIHGFIHKLRKYISASQMVDIINVRAVGYKLTVN